MNQLIGYARVSSLSQNLDSQIDNLKSVGCELIFEDKISGSSKEREGWNELIRYTQFISDYRLYSFKIIINSTMHVICDSWPRLIKKTVNFLLKFFACFKKLIISRIFIHHFP